MVKQFSPNMLKTFQDCSKKYNFKYEKNLSMPINDEIFEFGKNIHALASYYLRNEFVDEMEKSLTEKEQEVWEYLKQIKYFGYEVVNTEYSLMFKFENVFLGGRIDAIVKNQNTYYILDYKTGAVPKNYKYDFQTMIYLMAVKEYFKTYDIKFVYIDLRNKKEEIVDFDSDLEKEYKIKLSNILKQINNFSKNTCSEIESEIESEIKNNKCNKPCEYSKICY